MRQIHRVHFTETRSTLLIVQRNGLHRFNKNSKDICFISYLECVVLMSTAAVILRVYECKFSYKFTANQFSALCYR